MSFPDVFFNPLHPVHQQWSSHICNGRIHHYALVQYALSAPAYAQIFNTGKCSHFFVFTGSRHVVMTGSKLQVFRSF